MKIVNKLWLWIIAIIVSLLGIPCIINEFYKLNKGYVTMWGASDALSFYGSSLSFVGTVALGALALWQNYMIHKSNLDNMQPTLSMRLTAEYAMLYLIIENTGMSVAKNISIDVLGIQNNGNITALSLSSLFNNSFELHPKESVRGRVAIDGSSIAQEIFPILKIKVSYVRADCNKQVEVERTVAYDGINHNNNSDISNVITNIQFDIDKIARANVRIANYLDGQKVAKFDALDIISERSLKQDLTELISAAIPANKDANMNTHESK